MDFRKLPPLPSLALKKTAPLLDVTECGYYIDPDGNLKIRWVSDTAFPTFITVEAEVGEEQLDNTKDDDDSDSDLDNDDFEKNSEFDSEFDQTVWSK